MSKIKFDIGQVISVRRLQLVIGVDKSLVEVATIAVAVKTNVQTSVLFGRDTYHNLS